MSLIDTMSIMGVRSFGADDENQQVIKFQHPLTLLVGPNGAGKTTIIECLKYATTGEHPANTKGGAFVHDPKLANDYEVKARVRLKCKTIHGNEILVERGMLVTQKLKTTQFKTMDGIITKMKNDEKVSITSKCADLNKEMVLALGVSKAVLDNVIFCHQEDSNWPLSEGKSVKQRFDDIFAATRYIKALEEIRKIQKDRKAKKDIEEVELKHLKANTERAKDIKGRLTVAEKKLNKVQLSRSKVEEELTPVRERLEELSRKRSQIIQLDGELGALRSRKEQMMDDQKKLESRINNLFHGTDEQLSQLQEEQENVLKGKRQKQIQCEKRLRPLQQEIDKLNAAKTNLSIEQGKLQQEAKNALEKRNLQKELMKQVVEDTGIDVSFSFHNDISSDQVEEFEQQFKSFKASEMKQMKNQKADLDRDVKSCEEDHQTSWKAKLEVEEGSKHTRKNLEDIKTKLQATTRELNRISASGNRTQLDELQREIASAQHERDQAERDANFTLMRNELKGMTSSKESMEEEMEDLENDITNAQKTTQFQTRIELLEKDQKSKEKSLNLLKSKIRDPLSQLGLVSHSSFPNKVQLSSWIQEKEEELQSVQQDFNLKKSSLTKSSTELEMVSKQMKQKRSRHSELDESLFEVCGSQDIEEDITALETDIKKLQGKKGLTDGIQHMYRKFIGDMKREDIVDKKEVACPLCQRQFDETSEVDDLISILEEKLAVAPKKLENQAKDLEKKQTRYKILQKHKPLKIELDRLAEEEIPELEKRSSRLSAKVSELKKQTEGLEVQCSRLGDDVNAARNCAAEVARIDTLQAEIRELTREVGRLKSELPSSSSTLRSMDELQKEKKSLSVNLNKIAKLIKEKSNEMQEKTENINRLKEKVNKAQEEKLKLASDMQKCEQLQKTQKVLSDDIKRLKSELDEHDAQLAPLRSRLEESTQRKTQALRKREEGLTQMSRRKQDLESKADQLESVNREIQRFEEKGVEHLLKRNAGRISDLEKKAEQANRNLQQSHDEIQKLEKDLATCTDRKRDLEDNVALRERKRDLDRVEQEFVAMGRRLEGMDVSKLQRESRQLQTKHDKLSEDKIALKENEVRYKEETGTFKKQLNEDDNKFADERYRESLVKCSVFELAIKDLEKYYKALDRAVMRYHHIKMEEINKIIKELWQNTYRGRDIDYIEICSNEDTGSSGTRRVYNYRVVMYFEGVQMDMRGRCSAGQKVLASLVIRLALAETFCISCGILALDEPTTNLDRDNIESLAHSLVNIIESRSRQRNFQLVVITHDEDFVDLLGRSQYVDHFFRVQKNNRGRSRIYRCPIRELES